MTEQARTRPVAPSDPLPQGDARWWIVGAGRHDSGRVARSGGTLWAFDLVLTPLEDLGRPGAREVIAVAAHPNPQAYAPQSEVTGSVSLPVRGPARFTKARRS